MNERWYDKTVAQIEEILNTNSNTGLSSTVIKTRLKTDEPNVVYPIKHHSLEACFKKIISEPATALLFIIAIIAAWLNQSMIALVIVSLLAFNMIVSVIMYNKAYRIIEDMSKLSLPTSKVMRNGKMYLVKSEQLLQGDVIYLSVGDIVPADARIIECDSLQVLEVNVTGEIKPTEKDQYFLRYTHDVPPAQQANMLFASSIVIKGTAKAICCCMGEDTLVTKLRKNKYLANYDDLKALSTVKKYSKLWYLASIALVFLIVVLEIAFSSSTRAFVDIFITALSFAAATVSEFLILSSYVIVGNGLFSAVKQNKNINSGALIKNISKIENLKDISCLIVHKEGAFSVRDAKVEKVYVNNTLYTDGEVHFTENASRVLKFALISTGLYGAGKLIKNNLNNENIYTAEEDAIISIAQKSKVYNIKLDQSYPILEHVGIGETSRFETTLVNSKHGYTVACRGNLDKILSCCSSYCENGKNYPLDADKKTEIYSEAINLCRKSYRIIAIASKQTHYNTLKRIISCQSEMTFEGFIAIRERMLPGAAKNISDCLAAGIKIIMLTEDVGEHNKSLAESLGIIKDKSEIITGNSLSYMRDDMFHTNTSIYRLYQGLNIVQKRKLVEYLHDEGEIVGVLARELDEIILLKEADVGFVQSTILSGKLDRSGIDITLAKHTNSPMLIKNSKDSKKTGTEALKFISDVIISDADKRGNGGFNAMLNAVKSSKIIYKNIVRFIKYILTTNVARLFLILFTIFTKSDLFTPVQILFTGLVIDYIAMVIIAFENASNKETLKKENNEDLSTIQAKLPLCIVWGLVCGLTLASTPYILNLMGFTTTYIKSTVIFLGFIFTQIAVLNEVIKDDSMFKPLVRYNRAHLILIILLVGFLPIINFVPTVSKLFGTTQIGVIPYIVSLIPSIIIIIVFEIHKWFTNSSKG